MTTLHSYLVQLGLGSAEASAYLFFITGLITILFGRICIAWIVQILALLLSLISFVAGVMAQSLIILSASSILKRKPKTSTSLASSNNNVPQKRSPDVRKTKKTL